jgi:hypothetical protein
MCSSVGVGGGGRSSQRGEKDGTTVTRLDFQTWKNWLCV